MKKILGIAAGLFGIAGLGCLGFYFFGGSSTGKLAWDTPVVRKSLMTFAYKVYGNPAAQNGRYFLSKIVFHNDGTAPVHNLSVSYQIPDYLPWTTAETHTEVLPGQTVIQLFYPQLPSSVAQLANETTATLETRIDWSDKPGNQQEQILRSNVELRGVNEIEYTDLPANELLTWYDAFATAPFATAMVTPNDPVVKEYVAQITQRTGGTMAGIGGGPDEIVRMMKAVYDYMCATGMRYTSDEGVPSKLGDVETTVQTVRLPRDVIISNEGLCVELAILWSSIMEHLGCPTTVVFRPGHAFTLVWVGQGPYDFVPIECTAITPFAVGRKGPVPFEDAVKMAQQDLQQQRYQIWLNVREYQSQGFHAPELANIDIDKIKNILTQRSAGAAGPATEVAQNTDQQSGDNTGGDNNNGGGGDDTGAPQTGVTAAVRPGYYRFAGAAGLVSVDVPETWVRMENTPIPGMVFTAQDQQTSVSVNVFHYPALQTAAQAMHAARNGIANYNGGRVNVVSEKRQGAMEYYRGTTASMYGNTEWVGVFAPTEQGVIGIFVGAGKGRFQRNQALIRAIVNSAHFSTVQ